MARLQEQVICSKDSAKDSETLPSIVGIARLNDQWRCKLLGVNPTAAL